MDFMKVFDQTVREIKREVNLKVLKVPEIEQKVLDATDDEPWGPHGSALSEIAQATKKFSECQLIMSVLWTRLTEGSARWRHAYKALTVIEYLIANGSERAVDDILEHSSQISVLAKFEFVEPNGKDTGINVRKKVETIIGLINDKDKIKAVRDKATANRDKYVGLSSSGITSKSSISSSSSSSSSKYSGFGSSDRYGTLTGGTRESESFNDKKEDSRKKTSAKKKATTPKKSNTNKNLRSFSKTINDDSEDDFDDFDPRGSAKSGSNTSTINDTNKESAKIEVDFFGPNLMDDFLDTSSPPQEKPIEELKLDEEVDLFADADFQSAPPPPKPQDPMDLFAPVSSTPDLFSTPQPPLSSNTKPHPVSTDPFDPFESIPMTSSFTSDPFGDFTKNSSSSLKQNLNGINSLPQEPLSDDGFGTFTSAGSGMGIGSKNSGTGSGMGIGSKNSGTGNGTKSGFQVKSGIWADSLSKGLIDLNITVPKKVNLADIGIVGGLDDNNDKDKFSSFYMGSTGGSSNFSGNGQNNQYGGFK